MAPHLQRGGCDGLRGPRAGCRRRRGGAPRRPSPVGSTHRAFTAGVADALVERLAGELPTTARATAPADEQRRNKPQPALAAPREADRATTVLLAAREGLMLSPRRARVLTAALLSGALVAGCGGSSRIPTAATVSEATSPGSTVAGAATTSAPSTTSGRAAISSGPSSASSGPGALAFASCMRANGVPNYPDPGPGGGVRFAMPAGANPAAPAFRAAQAKCQKLLPNGGGPGSGPPPSDQTLARLVRIARCMRRHDISDFPDPRTSAPASFPSGIAEIANFDGAVLLFPQTLNMQAPAYRQALAACDAPPLGLPH
jgi:hypothetical protein